jgi:hypothetical protein
MYCLSSHSWLDVNILLMNMVLMNMVLMSIVMMNIVLVNNAATLPKRERGEVEIPPQIFRPKFFFPPHSQYFPLNFLHRRCCASVLLLLQPQMIHPQILTNTHQHPDTLLHSITYHMDHCSSSHSTMASAFTCLCGVHFRNPTAIAKHKQYCATVQKDIARN